MGANRGFAGGVDCRCPNSAMRPTRPRVVAQFFLLRQRSTKLHDQAVLNSRGRCYNQARRGQSDCCAPRTSFICPVQCTTIVKHRTLCLVFVVAHRQEKNENLCPTSLFCTGPVTAREETASSGRHRHHKKAPPKAHRDNGDTRGGYGWADFLSPLVCTSTDSPFGRLTSTRIPWCGEGA